MLEAPTVWNGYSVEERDRRWNAVRVNAARAGFHYTFVPFCIEARCFRPQLGDPRGNRSDGRYLTQMDNAAVILPSDERPPIVITERPGRNAWTESRGASGRTLSTAGGAALIKAFLDLGLERGHVGVSGLKAGTYSHCQAVDGVVTHSSYAEVVERFPNVVFEDATDVIGAERYVKSEEEIACLRRAAQIASSGLDELARLARPGVSEAELYAQVQRRLLLLGSDYHPIKLWTGPIDRVPYRDETPQVGRELGAGWLVHNELDGIFGDLNAQVGQPMVLGSIPDSLRPLIELQREAFTVSLELLKPGAMLAEIAATVGSLGQRRGLMSGITARPCGYGDDGPRITPDSGRDGHSEVLIKKDTAWIWQVLVASPDGRLALGFTSSVLVTNEGALQLAAREPGVLSLDN